MSKNCFCKFNCKSSDLVIFSPQLGISKNYAKWCQYFILLFRRFVDVLENIKSFRQIRPKTTERRTNIGMTRRNSEGGGSGSSLENDSNGRKKKKSSLCCCKKSGTDSDDDENDFVGQDVNVQQHQVINDDILEEDESESITSVKMAT